MRLENSLYQNDLSEVCRLSLPWEELRGKSLLLTGASGTIGTFLVDVLMQKNKQDGLNVTIFAVGRSEKNAKRRFECYWENPLFRFVSHDVNEPWEKDLSPDYMIHAASNTHPKAYAGDPVGTITSNVFGLYHLLNLAAACKTQRVLFLSSVEIYGQNKYGLNSFSEGDMGYIDCNTFRAGYPESKRVAESFCRAYEKKAGLDSVILRLCRIYGPTMPQGDSKALAQFIKNALNGEDIVLKSEGTQFFSYCYVADAVSAILTALLAGKSGEAYNVADPGSNIALRDLAKLIADANGVKVVFELPTAEEKQGFSVADRAVLNPGKLNALGWRAVTGIEGGVNKTIKILKAVKEW